MTYLIKLSSSSKRALKKLGRSGTFDSTVFNEVVHILEKGIAFPARYKDHQLHGELAHLRECHLGFDLLLLYERADMLGVVVISDIGTHTELFGE